MKYFTMVLEKKIYSTKYPKYQEEVYILKIHMSYIYIHKDNDNETYIGVVSDTISDILKNVKVGFYVGNNFYVFDKNDFIVHRINKSTFISYRENYLDLYLVFNSEKEYLLWKLKS